jgi:hypothetical protein
MRWLDKTAQLLKGLSYWQVKLSTGREFSELDQAVAFEPDPATGLLVARKRKIEWLEDIISSGDGAHIRELHLITPQGDASLQIFEPYSAFQIKRGVIPLLSNGLRIMNAQIIGRVSNHETGDCLATIWDVQEQRLYVDHLTTVRDFKRWRPGVADMGSLNYRMVGLEGIPE